MANELDLTITIDRTELSLSDIVIDGDATYYDPVSFGPGMLTRRRQAARSPFVDGEFYVANLKNQMQLVLDVRVKASTANVLKTKESDLFNAFDQSEYTIEWKHVTTSRTWTCQPAEWGPLSGGIWNKFELMSEQSSYRFLIPAEPVYIGA